MENLQENSGYSVEANAAPTGGVGIDSTSKNGPIKPGAIIEQAGKKSLLNLILVLILIVLLGASVYLFFSNKKLGSDQEGLSLTIERLKSQTGDMESKATVATKKQFLDGKKAERILWTNVLNRVFESNPASTELNQRLVSFVAISGGRDGNLSLSIKTRAASADPYADTAILLREFGRKTYFANLFIPNIASVLDQVGLELLSYTLNLQYLAKEDPIVELIEGINVDTTETVDVDELIEDESLQDEADNLRRRVIDSAADEVIDDSALESTTSEQPENLTTPTNG